MSYILFQCKVKNFDTWKEHFDLERQNRKTAGEKSYHLLCDETERDSLIVLFEWDTMVKARKYFDTIEFRKAMTSSGVVAKPSIIYMDSLEIQRVHGIRKEK
ncbi:MAG: hypothetical protein KDD94_00395 [Calditrichaeota bacterium]|nr:hypothetical protein [Calditrichota bacterium]